jgi:hypothetical protein
MEIIFNCPHCDQEMSVDSSGAGSEIQCPTCNETITIPEKSEKEAATMPVADPGQKTGGSAINTSAAAKVQMRLSVPVRTSPSESLIQKAAVPLDAVAKGADKQIRVRTIRHDKCVDAGHDKFDEIVSKALAQIGEQNIISLHTMNFEHFDVQTQKVMNDYGLIVVYRG